MIDTHVDIVPLGTGKGATAVYEGEASTAFVVRSESKPVLLIDAGLGVVAQCLKWCNELPESILITHNHTDHAGELPVLIAVEKGKGRRQGIFAAQPVMDRLRTHRIHELLSTGESAEYFADWRLCEPGTEIQIHGSLTVELRRGMHSEASFGSLFRVGQRPLFAYSSDSGFDNKFYEWLAQAPIALVDGRAKGSTEHAGFDEIAEFAVGHPSVRWIVTGFGRSSEAPDMLEFVVPGRPIN